MHKTRIRIVALLALAVMFSALTGCGRRGLIRVNGDKVTKEEFYQRLEAVTVQTPQGPKLAGAYVIEQIINEKLIQQLAAELKVAPTKAQIDRKLEFIKKESGGNLKRALMQGGITIEDLKRKIELEQSFVNVVSRGIDVPETEIQKAYYESLKQPNSPFVRPERRRMSAIFTKTKAKADKVYSMLASGMDFGAVALKMSDNTISSKNQGIIGWVDRNMTMVPQIVRDTLFSLKVGDFSKPVNVRGEFMVIRADQVRPKKVQKYDDVRELIREQLAVRRGLKEGTFRKDMALFTEKADIVVNADRYKDIPEMIKKQAADFKLPGAKTNKKT
jgi:parvulin-like peptidyl-prolyl isomerase